MTDTTPPAGSEQARGLTPSCQKLGCQAWALLPEVQALEAERDALQCLALLMALQLGQYRALRPAPGEG